MAQDMTKADMLEWLYGMDYLTKSYIVTEQERQRITDLVQKGLAGWDQRRQEWLPVRKTKWDYLNE